MKRDYIEIFHAKLKTHGIKGKDLALAAGRTPQNISEILNRKVTPSVESFAHLVDSADRLSPGFSDDFYLSLCGCIDVPHLVRSMGVGDVSNLLIIASSRLAELLPQRHNVAA